MSDPIFVADSESLVERSAYYNAGNGLSSCNMSVGVGVVWKQTGDKFGKLMTEDAR